MRLPPPAAELEREDNEAATRAAGKLGVRSFPGMARVAEGSPAESACMGAGAAKSVERDTNVVSTASWTPPHNGNTRTFRRSAQSGRPWRHTRVEN